MKTDIAIAQEATILPITEIAKKLGISEENLTPYGKYKAKVTDQINQSTIQSTNQSTNQPTNKSTGKTPKLILVTAINPTPAGEGKTTVTVGLGDALSAIDKHTVIALREPSLGPVFGVKGGAAGGGYAQVVPMEDINLHFTGDLHAITSAHNLLAAMLDNHMHQGNTLNVDPRQIIWRRALDMNDRQLRNIVNGLGGKINGVPREDGFDITAASEVMAVFCLSTSLSDLKKNLANIVVAYSYDGSAITAKDLKAEGAMTALLRDAFSPNLVQTLAHTPAFIHGGPFANIAHGCNTVAATRLALSLAQDYVVTEAGFGADLGAEKFFDIKCRKAGLTPSVAVVVATVRALKHHGGAENLVRHVGNIKNIYGLPVVVALNRFGTDTEEELEQICDAMKRINVPIAITEVFAKGGEGGIALAKAVVAEAEKFENEKFENEKSESEKGFRFAYDLDMPLKDKITTIAQKIYGASGVNFDLAASRTLTRLEKEGHGNLPICMAKTQYSFSDNAKLLGAPEGFEIRIRQVKLSAGAGFVVALAGDIMTMPGLPATPAAEGIDVDDSGAISGLF